MKQTLTCIECPLGCQIQVEIKENDALSVTGYTCLRGKAYAESEVVSPKRVITSTVRTVLGELIPVKTKQPIPKSEIFTVMEKINSIRCTSPVKIGDVVMENIVDGVDLVATGNSTKE